MSDFSNSLLIGASGGIGAALGDAIEARGGRVTRLGRTTTPAVDYARPETLAQAAATLADGAPYDALIIASGILHGSDWGPEKSWRALAPGPLEQTFLVNTIGPALALRHFLPLLPRKERCLVAALSARVGSIADNRLGGWYGYRASKAALNQLVRTLAIELARTHPQAVAVALHPGTVDTALSAPFQSNVPEGRLFTPAQSATHLLDVLAGLTPAESGGHFDWAGQPVPA
ncbi:SDR family NAD(P)-dependent oxidoreductase [Sphingomicrobium astaxanthinifaciens]|uniref:SDR family NAD(P)-dependent oxidoreductase n=1 Tax=Sphingomicrobium astaxanthinifaciens TaxID=1227949 RepID=UPI001FCC6B86|nr:SDR family NAD(P)-dependent oxidoreductase [Sphingomicrobium astaxanthinifaciens]MCJ7420798.1 SDR family NAD(P)-dependent oxidoreductase [Sphingomicrobium astaxanthinifaciens]